MVGFNQWDEEWEQGYYNSNGVKVTNAGVSICSKNKFRIMPNTTYYNKSGGNYFNAFFYDENENFILSSSININSTFVTPANACYMAFHLGGDYGTTYKHDICINISWSGTKDGEYEEYVKHSYPLDNDVILRGIPKLDVNNKLYYDGDIYSSNGKVARKYALVDLGTLDWSYNTCTRHNVYRYCV